MDNIYDSVNDQWVVLQDLNAEDLSARGNRYRMKKPLPVKLEPCPFCGSWATLYESRYGSSDIWYRFDVKCHGCGAQIYPVCNADQEQAMEAAIKHWNMRAGNEETRL